MLCASVRHVTYALEKRTSLWHLISNSNVKIEWRYCRKTLKLIVMGQNFNLVFNPYFYLFRANFPFWRNRLPYWTENVWKKKGQLNVSNWWSLDFGQVFFSFVTLTDTHFGLFGQAYHTLFAQTYQSCLRRQYEATTLSLSLRTIWMEINKEWTNIQKCSRRRKKNCEKSLRVKLWNS